MLSVSHGYAHEPGGEIRHPIFHGMRDDKPAAAVTEEPVVDVENGEPVEAETGSTRVQPGRRGNVTLSGQKISNAERVIDPVTGLKKIDLVRYYDEIAEWALPYLQDRPVSLARAQWHPGRAFFPEARRKNAHARHHEAFHRTAP
jgi:bifunctional non-homologous end joining protein LigD